MENTSNFSFIAIEGLSSLNKELSPSSTRLFMYEPQYLSKRKSTYAKILNYKGKTDNYSVRSKIKVDMQTFLKARNIMPNLNKTFLFSNSNRVFNLFSGNILFTVVQIQESISTYTVGNKKLKDILKGGGTKI